VLKRYIFKFKITKDLNNIIFQTSNRHFKQLYIFIQIHSIIKTKLDKDREVIKVIKGNKEKYSEVSK